MFAVEGHRVESVNAQILSDLNYKMHKFFERDIEDIKERNELVKIVVQNSNKILKLEKEIQKLKLMLEEEEDKEDS